MLNTNEIRIETSTLCNYKCKFCPHHTSAFTRKKEIMDRSIFRIIVQKLIMRDKILSKQITDITLSGFGEVFRDKLIMERLEWIRKVEKRKMNIHMLTNGSLLSPKKMDRLFSEFKIADLRFSVHSMDMKEYMDITGTTDKNFEKVMRNIEYAIKNKNETKIMITCDIMDGSEEEVAKGKKVYDYFVDKVDLVEVWKVHNWVDWGEYRSMDGKRIKSTCRRPFNGPIQVQVDGTVNMCCFDYNGKLLLGECVGLGEPMGGGPPDYNRKLTPFEEIYSGEAYKKIRQAHVNGMEDDLICKKCDQLIRDDSVLVFSSKFQDKKDRVNRVSTSFKSLRGKE